MSYPELTQDQQQMVHCKYVLYDFAAMIAAHKPENILAAMEHLAEEQKWSDDLKGDMEASLRILTNSEEPDGDFPL